MFNTSARSPRAFHTGGQSELKSPRLSRERSTFGSDSVMKRSITPTPGPSCYHPRKQLNVSPRVTIDRQERKIQWHQAKVKTPGPSAYAPFPLLKPPKKVTIRPRRVQIDLTTPGVGQYHTNPVQKRSPRAVIPQSPRITPFNIQKRTPGPSDYATEKGSRMMAKKYKK